MGEIQRLNSNKPAKYNSTIRNEIDDYDDNSLSTWEMIKLTVCMTGLQFTCEYSNKLLKQVRIVFSLKFQVVYSFFYIYFFCVPFFLPVNLIPLKFK